MPNNVRTQLQQAKVMRETVQDYAAKLDQKMNDLHGQLSYYVSIGFPEDIADTYRERYLVRDTEIISDLCGKMRTEHVEFLDKVIENLMRAGNAK